MNLSGEAARALLQFYKIPPKNLIAVVDDIYLDLGTVRIRTQGSHGGHNGLRNLMEHCGDAFTRVRIGVAPFPPEQDRSDFVLRKYGQEEAKVLGGVLAKAKGIVETGLSLGWNAPVPTSIAAPGRMTRLPDPLPLKQSFRYFIFFEDGSVRASPSPLHRTRR